MNICAGWLGVMGSWICIVASCRSFIDFEIQKYVMSIVEQK